jgi:hypothetical protein
MTFFSNCCFFRRRTKIYSTASSEVELDTISYIYLDMNIWNQLVRDALASPLFSNMIKTINILLAIPAGASTPSHVKPIADESHIKVFTSEKEAFLYAQQQQQGFVFQVKGPIQKIQEHQISWVKSFDNKRITFPAVSSPAIASEKQQSNLNTMRDKLQIAASAYLRKYPKPITKLFWGSHTHQAAATELLMRAQKLDIKNISSYLDFLTNYRRIYRQLSRGELTRSLQDINSMIYEGMRTLLGEAISDCWLNFSFDYYLKKIIATHQPADPIRQHMPS